MSRLIVDASVAIKWFVREVQSDSALAILRSGHQLYAPDFLYTECASILWKKVRRREFSEAEAWAALGALEAVPIGVWESRMLVRAALRVSLESGRSVYGSMYVACAIRWEIPMVTADERLYNATRSGPLARHIAWVADPPDREA